jgi:hypothetical protein
MYQKHGRNIRIQGIIIGIESAQLEAPFHFFAPFSERHDDRVWRSIDPPGRVVLLTPPLVASALQFVREYSTAKATARR